MKTVHSILTCPHGPCKLCDPNGWGNNAFRIQAEVADDFDTSRLWEVIIEVLRDWANVDEWHGPEQSRPKGSWTSPKASVREHMDRSGGDYTLVDYLATHCTCSTWCGSRFAREMMEERGIDVLYVSRTVAIRPPDDITIVAREEDDV